MSKNNNEAFKNLYERGKKLFERLNHPSLFEEPLKDSVIIANIGNDKENNNLKSYETLDKEGLLDYSIKPNGSLDNSKLKESISNTYIESSENGNNSRREGLLNSEGKYIKVDISQYNSLILKFGKIYFNSGFMNTSFVNMNDILYLESKIPKFKAKNTGEIIYDTLKNYHQQGSDKEDRNSIVNINQSNTHKINLDESNFAAIAGSNIYIFIHKIIQDNFKKKANGSKKDISSAQKTEVIKNYDNIIGYSIFEMNKLFLSEDFKYSGRINILERQKNTKNENEKKNSLSKNKRGKSKEKDKKDKKDQKDKKELLYNEKGERVIGSLEISCILKRPYQKIFKDDNYFMSSINKNINEQNNNNIYNNYNQINTNNLNNYKHNDVSPKREFIIGQPPVFNQQNNNIYNNNFNNSQKIDDFEDEKLEDDGMQKIKTDINGDILILYLKINELKASNDNLISQNSLTNLNNLNEQLNNKNNNKNIIFYNDNGPKPSKRNYFLRHKVFPDNKDARSEIIWNKVSPDFNYSIQMPFTLNQKTAELLDNSKFVIEIWTKGENNNECLGIVSFYLRNVLESLKVDDKTITTFQLYKNKFPYIIYDEYYPVESITDAPDLGALYLKVLLGIGTPAQINNYIKNTEPKNFNQYNGMYNSNINDKINEIKYKEKNQTIKNEEKNDISLDPFKEENQDINKKDIQNISKAADINVDGILEKNHKNLENNNLFNSKESSINQKDFNKKSESFDDQPNKKKIVNPFLVPQNYEQENKNTKKETGAFNNNFNNLINSDTYPKLNTNINNNTNESNVFNQGINNQNNKNLDFRINKEEKNISNIEKKTIEYNINITHKNYNENQINSINNNFNDYNQNIKNNNENKDYDNINDYNNNKINNNFIEDNNIKNKNTDYFEDEVNNKTNSPKIENKNDKLNEQIFINNEKNNNYISNNFDDNFNKNNYNDNLNKDNYNDNFSDKNDDIKYINKNKFKNDFDYENEFDKEKEKRDNLFDKNIINVDNIKKENNNNRINIINNMPQKELYLDEQHNNNIEIINSNNNRENISHVKKHIFTISIDKIYNCQIISKLPPTYLRYQFFTDQKPLRSELFNYSQYSIDSSVIDVDMKSIHSIILPKVEKIKDYLNDFLVEFLYDTNTNTSKNDNIIIGRVNIPSDEFASLINEKEQNKKNGINEINRVLFIYGTEKIQRNKCIIGKLKLHFKYACIDVPINQNNIFNGSLSMSNNNGLLSSINNNLGPNFAGSIYLEKETIFNRKIPKNACLKINVEKFNSSSLFEDYYRKQFSISFVFSVFGEISKMENQYGKRSTSKKHNLLNCEFNEILSYKLEIDQNIIDYLKCRSGIVYLVYKISKDKKNYIEDNNSENENEKENEEINDINLLDLGQNKRIIGKGIYNLNEILTSADTNYQEISISQIGNGSMSLGTLNISLTLENDNNNINIINEEGDNLKQNKSSPFNKFKQGLNNTTSDLYKTHNKTFNKCEPSFYLNGKFLFSIDFRKFYYETNSEIGNIINNSINFYFVFKLGNKIKKISPKFNKDNNELYCLNLNCNLLLINYVEMIELDLNFNKKIPNDIYNLFNEGIFEIKLYQNENPNSLGSFYIDLHKLITSELYSDNLLYSGNNVINLINVRNNSYRNCKVELNIAIFKLNEMQLNNDIMNKINSIPKNIINKKNENNDISNNNIVDMSLSNLDYCEYYQYLFVKDFSDYLIQSIFSDTITNNKNKEKDKDKDKEQNATTSEQNNETMNSLNLEKIKKLFNFNSVDMFNFINNNIINLIDNKGELNINNFKKIFTLITKLNFDIFDYYYTNLSKNENKFDTNNFDYYLNSQIINLDNEDINILYYLKDKQNKVDLGINNNSALNNKNNKTIKKLLTTNYNYEFNETNDYFDVVSLCLFIFDYYYNLNDGTLQNYLKIKNNQYSKTQPYIYKKSNQYLNHTLNNINYPNLNLNNNNAYTIDKSDSNINNNQIDSKIMVVSVLSGHNIIKPYSEFTSRPNCYFVLEFDDKSYTSDVVMNSSQPNFNEELEIKINSEEYTQKLNALLIYITVFSFVDENGSIFIGRCEISPSKMFPFLNDNFECEDFFHIIGEEGQVMGQLNIKFKFDPEVLGYLSRKRIFGSNNSFLMSNLNMSNENNMNNNKKNNNTISFSLNNVVENNNNNKFIMTGGFNENDPLHKKLAEAMNSIDDLTQILKNKVENERKENNNLNLNLNNNINKDFNINNNNNIIHQNVNLSDIKSEENVNTNSNELNNYEDNNNINDNQNNNHINDLNDIKNNNEYNNNNDNEENYDYGEEEEMNNEMEEYNEEMENNQFEDDIINNGNEINGNNFNNNINNNNNNIINENQYDKNKLTLTDFNNLNNSQKLSNNDGENEKASFYSDTRENNDNNNKMKYLKSYDKNILNKIQKIMKNQK